MSGYGEPKDVLRLHGHSISPPTGDLLTVKFLAAPINPANRLRPYNPAVDGPNLKINNPTRRDTTMLPAWGWLALAYRTNNPGAWLTAVAKRRAGSSSKSNADAGHVHAHPT